MNSEGLSQNIIYTQLRHFEKHTIQDKYLFFVHFVQKQLIIKKLEIEIQSKSIW